MPRREAAASISDFKLSASVLMVEDDNVIYHKGQGESSHSRAGEGGRNLLSMDESVAFRENLLRAMKEAGLSAAQLSRQAGLNARAVKDIEEGRVRSPKLSTVFALSKALGCDPGEMMGLGPRPKVQQNLAAFLSRYSEDEQARFLEALRMFRAESVEGR